mgnify:CR=1 FL=1
MTLLIADDSSLIQSNLSTLIQHAREDVEIEISSDVESTIRTLRDQHIDILILDIRFPDGRGYEVLRHIDFQENRPFVMVLTNHLNEKVREKSLKLGADLFLDKTEEYEKVVEEIVRLHHK